jgi:ABC-type multidrug transport system fused ATPase/permease subunit
MGRRFEREFLRPYRGAFVLGVFSLLIESVLLLPIPLLQGRVIDQLVAFERLRRAGATEEAERAARYDSGRTIGLVLAATVALYLARSLLAWRTAARMGRISQEVVVALRGALHRKLMRLPMAYFDAQQTGRIMARVTSDVGSILMFIRGGIIQVLNDLVLSVAIAILLAWLQWRLAIVALIAVPLYALNQGLFYRRLRQLSDEIRAHVSSLYALLSERISAVRLVRSFAREDQELRELDERIDQHRDASMRNSRASALLGAIAILISGLGTVFVIAYGVVLVGRDTMTVGELLAIYALVGQLYQPVVRLTQFQATALSTIISVERLYEIFDQPEPVRDREGAIPITQARGALGFHGVSFAYSPGGHKVLEEISLTIEPGMSVGLLGHSGAGKSTLLALCPRLYDIPDVSDADGKYWGAITFDGRDIRDLRLADLRQAISLVPQQALLFEGSIRSNLLYARPDATDEEMHRALTIADLTSTVESFPAGLDTPVSERGDSLSGGQRQRLALARAIVARPAVLLLDDCTSALDAETEARIQHALERLVPRPTCIIVSHKVASVRRADMIVILEAGRIVELGNHSQLIAKGGHYATTYTLQTADLEGYLS